MLIVVRDNLGRLWERYERGEITISDVADYILDPPEWLRTRGRGDEEWHGTLTGHQLRGCRCNRCRALMSAYTQQRPRRPRQARGRSAQIPDRVHGTENGYKNYGCRCDDCRTAHTAYFRERRRARREKHE